jgi:hypothetical protein
MPFLTVNRFETLEQPEHEHPCVLAVPKFQNVQEEHGHFEDDCSPDQTRRASVEQKNHVLR